MYPLFQGQDLNVGALLSDIISSLADIYNTENVIAFLIQSMQSRATLPGKDQCYSWQKSLFN